MFISFCSYVSIKIIDYDYRDKTFTLAETRELSRSRAVCLTEWRSLWTPAAHVINDTRRCPRRRAAFNGLFVTVASLRELRAQAALSNFRAARDRTEYVPESNDSAPRFQVSGFLFGALSPRGF